MAIIAVPRRRKSSFAVFLLKGVSLSGVKHLEGLGEYNYLNITRYFLHCKLQPAIRLLRGAIYSLKSYAEITKQGFFSEQMVNATSSATHIACIIDFKMCADFCLTVLFVV